MKKVNTFELVLTSMFVAIILLLSLVPQLGFLTILPGVSLTIIHIPTLIGIFLLKPRSGFILGTAFGIGSLIAAFIYAGPADLVFQNPLVSVLPRMIFGIVSFYILKGLKVIEKIKFGNTLIFGLVSLITIFGLYFGSLKIAQDTVYSSYNNAILINNEFYEEHDETDLPPYSDDDLNELYLNANTTFDKAKGILIPVVLLIAVIFIAFYYYLINKNQFEELVVPASFIIATLFHTFIVLTAMVLFGGIINIAFGDAVNLIYSIILSNGLIEAFIALFIGTPIYFTLKKLPVYQRLPNN